MSPLSLTGSRPRESPLPLCEVGRDPPARGCHPEDRRRGDPPDPGFPGWVGLGVERYPCRAHFPDIGLEVADYLLGGRFLGFGPELAGCLLGGHYPCQDCFPDFGCELADFDLPVRKLAGLPGDVGLHRRPMARDLPGVLLVGLLGVGGWGIMRKNLQTV